jgi:transposase, IS30 family
MYQHIWTDKRHGCTLFKHLRQSNKKRKKQYGSKDKRGQIRNRVSIVERPPYRHGKKTALAIGK